MLMLSRSPHQGRREAKPSVPPHPTHARTHGHSPSDALPSPTRSGIPLSRTCTGCVRRGRSTAMAEPFHSLLFPSAVALPCGIAAEALDRLCSTRRPRRQSRAHPRRAASAVPRRRALPRCHAKPLTEPLPPRRRAPPRPQATTPPAVLPPQRSRERGHTGPLRASTPPLRTSSTPSRSPLGTGLHRDGTCSTPASSCSATPGATAKSYSSPSFLRHAEPEPGCPCTSLAKPSAPAWTSPCVHFRTSSPEPILASVTHRLLLRQGTEPVPLCQTELRPDTPSSSPCRNCRSSSRAELAIGREQAKAATCRP